MANTWHGFASWVGSEGDDLYPGEAHYWWMTGFSYGNAVSVTAHPVIGPPVSRQLEVQDVRVEGTSTGLTLLFTVKNVGPDSVPGYGVGFGIIAD
jgi:hypothetical protein